MSRETFRERLVRELPQLLQQDPTLRMVVLDIVRPYFAGKQETESRFDRMLNELRRMREESERRWQENQRRWEEWQKTWEEERHKWEQQWQENQRRWEENERRWQENQRRWEENWKVIKDMMSEIKNLRYRFDSTLGALGARWGVHAEETFRQAIAGILKDLLPEVKVTRVVEWDDTGEVFGRPDQVELDLIIHDGQFIIGEIKSSMSKGEIYLFERKARFYEKRHGRKADRLIVISPMVEEDAREVAQQLGIEVYTYADDAARSLSTSSST